MPTIYTVGYKGKPLSTFIGQLRDAGIDVIVDVRLRNTSHLAGYTKRDTLAFLLREGFGIDYEHHPELAPTPEVLDSYRDDQDWAAYESGFLPLLESRTAEEIGRQILAQHRAPCLLCAEPSAERCHRRLVAEHWARHSPNVTIVHL